MEWLEDGEWKQDIRDPNEMIHPIIRVIPSMADRFERCGSIGVDGYWREPPKGLRAVQFYQAALSKCKARVAERVNGGN